VLLWERQGSESLSETAKRHPVQVKAYQEETQGESLAWLDATTFYTTSDQTSDQPIYQHVRPNPATGFENQTTDDQRLTTKKVLRDGQILIIRDGRTYTLQGQRLF
jgi:hypothetical protein